MGRSAGTSLSTTIWSIKQGKPHTLLYANSTNEWYAKDASKGTKFEKHMKRWQIPVFVTIINYYLSIEVVNKTLVMEIDGFS